MAPLSEVRLNSKLGTGSGPGSLSPSHETKGCWDPCVFIGFSQCCVAQCHEHTRPGNQFKATGPSVQSTEPTTFSQCWWGGKRTTLSLQDRHPRRVHQRAAVKGLQGSPKLRTLLALHHFYNSAGKHYLWIEVVCSYKTELGLGCVCAHLGTEDKCLARGVETQS